MRQLLLTLLCALCVPCWAQPETKIAMPCESKMQSLSPVGDYVAIRCIDSSWHLVALPSGKITRSFESRTGLTDYSFSDDGKWFVAGFRDGTVQLVPLESAAPPLKFRAGQVGIDAVRLLPGDAMVVVAPHEAPGQVWQVAPAFRLVATLPTDFSGLTFIAASPDGKLVATGGADTTIRIYDTATWKTLHELRQFTVEPFAGAFTPNSKYLLVGGADNQITLLDPLTGKEGRKFTASKDVVAEIHPLGDNARVIAVQWDADGKNPAYLSIWELGKGPGKKISGARPITGGGVVKGNPWFTSASARTLQIWSGDLLVAGN